MNDPEELKADLVTALPPRFNRRGRTEASATDDSRTGVWWVNQGQTFEGERETGIVFSGTSTIGHHANVDRMRPGDVVLHYRRGELAAIGEVVAEPEMGSRPYGPADQRKYGRMTRVEYFDLDRPIPLAELPDREGTEGPFTVNGTVEQGYLFPLDVAYAERLRAQAASAWPQVPHGPKASAATGCSRPTRSSTTFSSICRRCLPGPTRTGSSRGTASR